MNEEIINYIRQYRGVYTREAITAELLKQGFSEKEINEAWFMVESTPAGQELYTRKPEFWLFLLGFLLGMPLLAGVFGGLNYEPDPSGYNLYSGAGAAFNAELAVVIIVYICGLAGYFFLRRGNRAAARGLIVGMILSIMIPFIPVIIIGGVCTITYQFR